MSDAIAKEELAIRRKTEIASLALQLMSDFGEKRDDAFAFAEKFFNNAEPELDREECRAFKPCEMTLRVMYDASFHALRSASQKLVFDKMHRNLRLSERASFEKVFKSNSTICLSILEHCSDWGVDTSGWQKLQVEVTA